MTGKTVVLRNIRGSQDTRHLQASLTREGDLVIEGQDIGDAVEQIFGVREYEWIWTIRARDIAILLSALGATSDVLKALSERFGDERAAELKSFLDDHDVPHDIWSRMGD
jgi:hypothetical protein